MECHLAVKKINEIRIHETCMNLKLIMLYEESQSQDTSYDFIYMKCIEKTNLYRQKIAKNRKYRGKV